jgi:hypothetical protein
MSFSRVAPVCIRWLYRWFDKASTLFHLLLLAATDVGGAEGGELNVDPSIALFGYCRPIVGVWSGQYRTKHHESRCKFCLIQLARRKRKNVGSNPGVDLVLTCNDPAGESFT